MDTAYTKREPGTRGNVTLQYRQVPIQYTITYSQMNAPDATQIYTIKGLIDGNTTVPLTLLTSPDMVLNESGEVHHFTGWRRTRIEVDGAQSDWTKSDWEQKELYTNGEKLTGNYYGNVRLGAQYNVNTLTLQASASGRQTVYTEHGSLDGEGQVTIDGSSFEKYFGQACENPVSQQMAEKGWVLAGWYSGSTKVLNADGTIAANMPGITSEGAFAVTGAKTLTARYVRPQNTLTLKANSINFQQTYTEQGMMFEDGTIDSDGSSFENYFGEPAPSDLVRNGWTLQGWYSNGTQVLNANGTITANLNGITSGYSFAVTGNQTLTARWKRNMSVFSKVGSISNGNSYFIGKEIDGKLYLLSEGNNYSVTTTKISPIDGYYYWDSSNSTDNILWTLGAGYSFTNGNGAKLARSTNNKNLSISYLGLRPASWSVSIDTDEATIYYVQYNQKQSYITINSDSVTLNTTPATLNFYELTEEFTDD